MLGLEPESIAKLNAQIRERCIEGIVLVPILKIVIQYHECLLARLGNPLQSRIDANLFRDVVVLQQADPVEIGRECYLGIHAAQARGEIALWKLDVVPVVTQRHGEVTRLIPGEAGVNVDALAIEEIPGSIVHAPGKFSLPSGVESNLGFTEVITPRLNKDLITSLAKDGKCVAHNFFAFEMV